MYHPLTRNHLYCAAQVTAYFDDFGSEKSGTGTASFVKRDNGRIYLVSNRHVFDAKYADARKGAWTLRRISVAGYSDGTLSPFKFSFAPPELLTPENEHEDVAAFDLTEVTIDGSLPSGGVIPLMESYLAKKDDFDVVDICDVVGFPVFHGPATLPVMRTGWIASDPSKDFVGHGLTAAARRIAIDGFSWGGYSGAPVFTLDKGLEAVAGVKYGGGFRASKVIGVNAGHIKVADGSGAHAGLSYLIKSTVLLELINK